MSDDATTPAPPAPRPIEQELEAVRAQLQILAMRAGELTEIQRQQLLAELLCLAYLLRAPIFAGRLQFERDVFGRTFLR